MSSPARYDAVAMSLHWLMAVIIIGLWSLGLIMEELPKGDFRNEMKALHVSIGAIVLGLTVLRLGWRLSKPAPELPQSMTGLEQLMAGAAHVGLYVLMLVLPVSGIAIVETGGRALNVFGFQVLPAVMAKHEGLHDLAEDGHGLLAWILAAIVIGHLLAALRHHLLLKDDVLARMLPGGK